ncbi:MAG: hypothetical protein AAF170_14850 [Bacteroidota bacterium]
MRWTALCLALLVSAAAPAQSIASSTPTLRVPESPVEDRLDVVPAVAADATVMGSAAVGLSVAACVIVTGLTQEDVTFTQSLLVAGVCGVLAGAVVCVNAEAVPERVHVASGAAYDPRVIAAFAADQLSFRQQAALAKTAREDGRAGVVLQRLTEARAGVGAPMGQVLLEVAVVDAETSALRQLDNGTLLPQTVASVPIVGSLSSARAEALVSFTL